VEEIHLSMTVMMTGLNGRLYYPNEKLRLIPFINITRSGNKGESFKVLVDISTPSITAVMEALRVAGDGVIKAAPTEFSNVLAVNLKEGGSPLKMMISVRDEAGQGGVWGVVAT
jgi:small-conductance mechanosensitive channel